MDRERSNKVTRGVVVRHKMNDRVKRSVWEKTIVLREFASEKFKVKGVQS